eukprot:scaffold20241_cov69-Phaeocystis_antarctica.AAC.2
MARVGVRVRVRIRVRIRVRAARRRACAAAAAGAPTARRGRGAPCPTALGRVWARVRAWARVQVPVRIRVRRPPQPTQLRCGQGGLGLQQREAEDVDRRAHRRRLARREGPQPREGRLEERRELRAAAVRHPPQQQTQCAQRARDGSLVNLRRLGRLLLVRRLGRRGREGALGQAGHELLAAVEQRAALLVRAREGGGEGGRRRAPDVVLRVALAAEPRRHERAQLRRELPAQQRRHHAERAARLLAHLPRDVRREPPEGEAPVREELSRPLGALVPERGVELDERLELGRRVALAELLEQHLRLSVERGVAEDCGEQRRTGRRAARVGSDRPSESSYAQRHSSLGLLVLAHRSLVRWWYG